MLILFGHALEWNRCPFPNFNIRTYSLWHTHHIVLRYMNIWICCHDGDYKENSNVIDAPFTILINNIFCESINETSTLVRMSVTSGGISIFVIDQLALLQVSHYASSLFHCFLFCNSTGQNTWGVGILLLGQSSVIMTKSYLWILYAFLSISKRGQLCILFRRFAYLVHNSASSNTAGGFNLISHF